MSTLPGMPRRLWSASPSSLTTWLDCPRRFRLGVLERAVPRRAWAHQSLGTSVHNALREWWSQPLSRRTPDAAGGLVRSGWIDAGFRDAEQSDRWRDRSASWVEAYAATLDPADEPAGVERTVGIATEVLALNGRVDRIDRRVDAEGERLVVVDYKTGRRVPDEQEARSSLALAFYAVASARVLHRPCRRVELHHLPSGAVAAWEHTPETLARHLQRADRIGAEARAAAQEWRDAEGRVDVDALFPPRPGSLCGWCDARALCPEGAAAAPEVPPWGGLAEAADPPP